MRISSILVLPVILMHLFLSTSAASAKSVSVPITDISSWTEKQFVGLTDYQPVVIDGIAALKAHSVTFLRINFTSTSFNSIDDKATTPRISAKTLNEISTAGAETKRVPEDSSSSTSRALKSICFSLRFQNRPILSSLTLRPPGRSEAACSILGTNWFSCIGLDDRRHSKSNREMTTTTLKPASNLSVSLKTFLTTGDKERGTFYVIENNRINVTRPAPA